MNSDFDNQTRAGSDSVRVTHGTDFQRGQLIDGRYEVISRLGQGGMGLVYRVNQVLLNQEFALKTIDKKSSSDMLVRRFQQEARASFALRHPNIVGVNDFGVLGDQTPFLVMELVKGETLGERFKRTGIIPLDEAIPIFVQACFGLAYAHERGIVHRDIKPSNIMLVEGRPVTEDGSVKILDFGIAKFTSHEGGEIQALTRTGEIFGSPLYMSPEQCSGSKVDLRADMYALGCVFFEALTGAPPFMGENALTTMMKHQGEHAPTLKESTLGGEFPQSLENIIARMLAKSPEDRYKSMGDIAFDLGSLKRGAPISRSSAKPAQVVPVPKSSKREISMSKPWFYAMLVGVSVLSAGAGLIGMFAFNSMHPQQNDHAGIASATSGANASTTNTSGTEGGVSSAASHSTATQNAKAADKNISELDESHFSGVSKSEMRDLSSKQPANGWFHINMRQVSAENLKQIATVPWVHQVSFTDCLIDNDGLKALASMKLTHLNFSGCDFNDVGAKQVAQFGHLENLNARRTRITNDGLSALVKIKNLKNLTLGETRVTDKGLAVLASAKKLDYVDMKENRQVTDQSIGFLRGLPLTGVALDGTSVGDSGLQLLADIKSLRMLGVRGTKVSPDGVRSLLRRSSSIERVYLRSDLITASDVAKLRREFPKVDFMYEALR